jgi:hypothetical protein
MKSQYQARYVASQMKAQLLSFEEAKRASCSRSEQLGFGGGRADRLSETGVLVEIGEMAMK